MCMPAPKMPAPPPPPAPPAPPPPPPKLEGTVAPTQAQIKKGSGMGVSSLRIDRSVNTGAGAGMSGLNIPR